MTDEPKCPLCPFTSGIDTVMKGHIKRAHGSGAAMSGTENVAVPERELAHLLLCSFRYTLGRRTYIVTECRGWLEKYWHIFPEQWKEQICNDIQQSLNADRAGMRCDREDWLAVLRFAERQKAGQS